MKDFESIEELVEDYKRQVKKLEMTIAKNKKLIDNGCLSANGYLNKQKENVILQDMLYELNGLINHFENYKYIDEPKFKSKKEKDLKFVKKIKINKENLK